MCLCSLEYLSECESIHFFAFSPYTAQRKFPQNQVPTCTPTRYNIHVHVVCTVQCTCIHVPPLFGIPVSYSFIVCSLDWVVLGFLSPPFFLFASVLYTYFRVHVYVYPYSYVLPAAYSVCVCVCVCMCHYYIIDHQ